MCGGKCRRGGSICADRLACVQDGTTVNTDTSANTIKTDTNAKVTFHANAKGNPIEQETERCTSRDRSKLRIFDQVRRGRGSDHFLGYLVDMGFSGTVFVHFYNDDGQFYA